MFWTSLERLAYFCRPAGPPFMSQPAPSPTRSRKAENEAAKAGRRKLNHSRQAGRGASALLNSSSIA